MTVRRRTKRRLYLGVDPGKKGFLCVYDGRRLVASKPIPYLGSEVDVGRLVKILRVLKAQGVEFAALEIQMVYGKQGAVSAGTTMGGYMAIKAALAALEVPTECVKPETWKRALGIPKPTGKLPALPKKLPEGSSAAVRARHKRDTKAIEKKRVNKRNELTRERKELALRRATELSPETDWRANERCKVPSDGKFEAFLISVYAYRTARGD